MVYDLQNFFPVDEGGVCARYHEIIGNESSPSHWESHNTGVFNLAYNYRELPANVAKLAFAHEIGHSLGSPVRMKYFIAKAMMTS